METIINRFFIQLKTRDVLTFISITLFYFFEAAQMSYFNVLAPSFMSQAGYQHGQIAAVSAAYYYGDMVGLFPVGYLLDHFSLRKILIYALIGSIFGAFLLFVSDNFYIQWVARFICGLFGGTFSFLGGIRVIATVFPKRFSYYMGLFLAAGMFGGLLSQYPLLISVHHFGIIGTMQIMFGVGVLVMVFNLLCLHPNENTLQNNAPPKYKGTFWKMFKEIACSANNWCDVLMVVLLDTPVSIIGTLWGVVLLMNFFHFSASISSTIVMALFAGLIVGLPVWGNFSDKRNNPAWIVILGATMSFLMCLGLFFLQTNKNPWLVAILFGGLGFFSSCQSIGFTWLTKNMKPELIGRNSAFNSMIFMGTNGSIKQVGAILLGIPAILLGSGSAANLLLIISGSMLLAAIYACFRNTVLFKKNRISTGPAIITS